MKPLSHYCRLAILSHGLEVGGGVPAVTRWLRDGLRSTGLFEVSVIDLATSRKDVTSRRLTDPRTWMRRSLRGGATDADYASWGANGVELEFMRYLPRKELTRHLQNYDILQVVCGSPAWAATVRNANRPTVVQAATTVAWERAAVIKSQTFPRQTWTKAMTTLTTRVEKAGLRAADAFMVENQEMLRWAQGHNHRRAILAPPGVDTGKFHPPIGGRRRDGYLLSLCRLGDSRKGLDRLVLAYKRLLVERPTMPNLVIAGKGTLYSPVAELIAALGLTKKVTVLSDVPEEDLVDLYQGASVFVQTSHEEGLGLALLEAMACGLPVVSTETAGSNEIVQHGVSGWLVAQQEADRVAEGVAAGIDVLLSEAGEEFSVRARDRCVSNFSTEATLRAYLEVYESLISTAHCGV